MSVDFKSFYPYVFSLSVALLRDVSAAYKGLSLNGKLQRCVACTLADIQQ